MTDFLGLINHKKDDVQHTLSVMLSDYDGVGQLALRESGEVDGRETVCLMQLASHGADPDAGTEHVGSVFITKEQAMAISVALMRAAQGTWDV